MNKIKSLISAFAFILITTASFAIGDIGTSTLEDLRAEIATHLSTVDFSDIAEDSATMKVQFLVNNANEVVVLSVNDERFDSTIKSRLNYTKLDTDGVQKNTIISVPITFKK